MGTIISFREERQLALTKRRLAEADRSILRQLHVIGCLDRRKANLSFAARALKHMLIAHHRLEKQRAQLEHEAVERRRA